MAASQRYTQLIERERALRQTFLPAADGYSDIGEYDIPTRDKASAYRLLMHAEIENFIEDRVTDACEAAHKIWQAERRITRSMLGMVISYDKEMKGPRKVEGAFLDWMSQKVYVQTMARIGTNHGIKHDNVYALLCSAGFLDEEMDFTLLATLNSFGKGRGDTAHKGGMVRKEIDPKSEGDTVNEILNGLKSLDEKLTELCI